MRSKILTYDILPERLVAEFFDKLDRTGGCWLYKGAKFRKGYGNVHSRAIGNIGAHVVAFLIANKRETLYPWDCVLHSCDNPPCCNPEHLFRGTKRQNTQDCILKGRFVFNIEHTRGKQPRGEGSVKAKLTAVQVQEIRQARKEGIGQKVLAKQYGVRYQTIQAIDHGRTWNQ